MNTISKEELVEKASRVNGVVLYNCGLYLKFTARETAVKALFTTDAVLNFNEEIYQYDKFFSEADIKSVSARVGLKSDYIPYNEWIKML